MDDIKEKINESTDSLVENNENKQNLWPYFKDIKQLIDDHFNKIKGMIRYSKEKDANVLALSKQVEIYREGIENVLFKKIALELIAYRESCRKSFRECGRIPLSAKDASKYIGYLKLDFEDVFENLGIKCDGDTVLYNGKNIDAVIEKVTFSEAVKPEEVTFENTEIKDFGSLAVYLENCESSISKMIQNNTVLDLLIKDYISIFVTYEQGVYQAVLYPVIRSIVKTYRNLADRIEGLSVSDENAVSIFTKQLEIMIQDLEKVLEQCNVSIDSFVSDKYDPKKQRILKMIDTDKPELNGEIINRYTDCYIMDEKVIYLSKVDVYKTK